MDFEFILSSYFCSHSEITLRDNKLSRKDRFDKVKSIVTPETLKLFWEKIKALHIDTWDSEYIDDAIFDGTQWELKVKSDFLIKKIVGSNAFPDGGIELDETPIFDELIKAVEFLIGEEDFFNLS
ncbi:hypothetical protein [Namhaeicola litoreus]|uniref:Uncharacterized protein n=1 Tax=Namhaeicola litoreus TaxID=1052145 RepID=A0ABW3XXE4_9FLAO